MNRDLQLKNYGYTLPGDLIAQYPLAKRDHARLLVVDREHQTITHDVFRNIGQYLPKNSAIVVNNSKVIPARLLGTRKTGGRVEIFLLNKQEDRSCYEVLIRPLRKIKEGEEISIDGKLSAALINKDKRIVRFNTKDLIPHLQKSGHMPLPPYITRPDEKKDKTDYQTVYAKHPGSVASPTAGLHFTSALLSRLKKQGHSVHDLTLHINYGTFKPVEEENITGHQMHFEEYSVRKGLYENIKEAKDGGRTIVAVGTTSCRTLETVANKGKYKGTTNLFIYPGYKFRMVDILITNFHLPFSTLLMLVCAFGGRELIMRAYNEAVKEKYRFYSYGDAMIIK